MRKVISMSNRRQELLCWWSRLIIQMNSKAGCSDSNAMRNDKDKSGRSKPKVTLLRGRRRFLAPRLVSDPWLALQFWFGY